MKYNLSRIGAALLITLIALSPAFANAQSDESSLVDARVVEVTEKRISVVAQTGVEHVIAINDSETKVQMGDRQVSAKDLQVGDVITIELDDKNIVKFAKLIEINRPMHTEVAQVPE